MKLCHRIGSATGFALTFLFCHSSLADEWVWNLTPTSRHVDDAANSPSIYVSLSQTVTNPAGCMSTDGYVLTDPTLANSACATALAALMAGNTICVLVSHTQCASNGRPLAKAISTP